MHINISTIFVQQNVTKVFYENKKIDIMKDLNLVVGQEINLSDLCEAMGMEWAEFESFLNEDIRQGVANFDVPEWFMVVFDIIEVADSKCDTIVRITEISEI